MAGSVWARAASSAASGSWKWSSPLTFVLLQCAATPMHEPSECVTSIAPLSDVTFTSEIPTTI